MTDRNKKIDEILERAVVNFAKSIPADTVKSNVEFEANAGMRPRIVRSSNGKCCPWCSSLAGEYYADEAPDDIYARHDNCTCTVTYISEKGYQDAHTKKWIEQQETEARRSRIAGDQKYIETLRREREAEKNARIKNLSKQRKHPYTTLVSDVNCLYYQTDSPQIRKIPDQAVYIVANLPKSGSTS